MITLHRLKQKVERLLDEAEGNWAIVFEDLDKDELWEINGNHLFYAASIIKLPIMATAFSLADQGKIKLSDMIVVQKPDMVGGSGVLQHLTPGITLSLYNLLMLMIIQSDNTATNIVIEQVGKQQIQETMKELGMVHSTFYNTLMTVPVKIEGKNRITACDVSLFLRRIATGKFSSCYACEQMVQMMKRQQIHYLSATLPENRGKYIGVQPEWMMASKTGHVTGSYHDVGILYVGNRTVTISVLSEESSREIALSTISEIGEAVYCYVSDST